MVPRHNEDRTWWNKRHRLMSGVIPAIFDEHVRPDESYYTINRSWKNQNIHENNLYQMLNSLKYDDLFKLNKSIRWGAKIQSVDDIAKIVNKDRATPWPTDPKEWYSLKEIPERTRFVDSFDSASAEWDDSW